ncbi:reticulon-like protein B5 [Andrographis paniculata]|uniref:reticulon-like protein B5 n=1 Tax=Andrographis paniculata TaxID=175694 RepID=UPI0021E7A503|nr:reticulon-like protein B5 [Andrographis paniculata]
MRTCQAEKSAPSHQRIRIDGATSTQIASDVISRSSPSSEMARRNKRNTGVGLAGATIVWLIFQRIGYSFITFICRLSILSLVALFLWSNFSFYIKKTTFNFPEITLPEDLCNIVALSLTDAFNKAIGELRKVALGKDTVKFLQAVFAMWFVSVASSWLDFLTIVYMSAVFILMMPLLHDERNDDQVDSYAQKAKSRITKQYSTLDGKVRLNFTRVPFIVDNKQEQQQQQQLESGLPVSNMDGQSTEQ